MNEWQCVVVDAKTSNLVNSRGCVTFAVVPRRASGILILSSATLRLMYIFYCHEMRFISTLPLVLLGTIASETYLRLLPKKVTSFHIDP